MLFRFTVFALRRFDLSWIIIMGSHRAWRKIAKRERRRRIRTCLARENDSVIQNWLKEQEVLENFEREQIEKSNREENEKWVQAERAALEQWKKLQEKLEAIQKEHLVQQERQKMELELEQKRKADEEKRLKEVEKENIEKQTMFLEKLEQYISGGATEPPEELITFHETKPSCEICPFFSKTACCRFGDQCSRNHQYPGISNVLLAPNFYVHFGLENAKFNEYDTDVMLEYEDNDTYAEFKNFFYDVLPEFQKFGKITQFKVCNNYEKHLRGNTYVEFEELRCSVAAYRALHSRWYGGRQLSLRFCRVDSWKNAICGLQSRRRCPKGRSCNFLHVFRNPENMFNTSYSRRFPESATHSRSWRWSESPEVELHSEKSRKKRRSNSSERSRKDREKRKHEDKKRSSRRRSERRKSKD